MSDGLPGLVCRTPDEVAARLKALTQRRIGALRGQPLAAPAPAPPLSPPSARPPTPPDPAPSSLLDRHRAALRQRGRTAGAAVDLPRPAPAGSAPASPGFAHEGASPDAVLGRIQARVKALAAADAAAPPPTPAPQGLTGRLAQLRAAVAAGAPGATPALQLDAFEACLPGTQARTALGDCWRMDGWWGADHRHGDVPLGDLLGLPAALTALLAQDAAFADFDPRRAVFFDLETTGLAVGQGTLPFLIGALHFAGGAWVLEQWLLRTPDDEPAALAALAARVAEADWAVSFNGRTYDAPLLAVRYRAHGLPDPFARLRGHLDLLPISRRLLGDGLPNRKLTTLEAAHLGLRRVGDVPGAGVPARYTAWLQGGDPRALVDVVHHNRDDILSMVALLVVLLRRADTADSLVLRSPKAALALARAAEGLDPERARRIYAAAAAFPDTERAGRLGLARVRRRGATVR